MTRALLLADAGPDAGLGHLARSTGLAQALAETGPEPSRVALGVDGPQSVGGLEWSPAPGIEDVDWSTGDVVVLDSYRVPASLAAARAGDAPLAVFWDQGEPPAADLIVSLSLQLPAGTQGLSGPEYACLRREFWEPPPARAEGELRRVLVAAGGGDVAGIAGAACEAAVGGAPGAEVQLVVGPHAGGEAPDGVTPLRAPSSLRDALLAADLVVTAAGQTLLEALASGAPSIALPVVANQVDGTRMLADEGAVRMADPGDAEALRAEVASLAGDASARRELGRRGSELIDGQGARRVAEAVAALV